MTIGERFVRERVVLGDRRYERRTFVGCGLVFDGRPVHLVSDSFDGCVWSFEGAAGATLDALAALCRGGRGLQARVARELGLPPGPFPAAGPGQRRGHH